MAAIEEWWNELAAGWQVVVIDVLVLAAALFSTRIVVKLVKSGLTAKGFDEYFRPPWSIPPSSRGRIRPPEAPQKRITPSELAAALMVATVWAVALWFVATLHGWTAFSDWLWRVMGSAWILSIVVVVSMLIGGWISRAIYGLSRDPWLKSYLKEADDEDYAPPDTAEPASFPQFIARAVGMAVYFIVFLLALLTATEILRLATVSSAVLAFWELALRLLTAGVAVGIGLLGVAWAKSASARREGEADVRLGYQVGLGILAATVALSIVLLAGGSNLYAGIFIILLLGALAWSLRHYIRDLWAGLFLKGQDLKEIFIDGVSHEVRRVGPLMTELVCKGEVVLKRNREALSAATGGEKEHRKRFVSDAYEKLKQSVEEKRSSSVKREPPRAASQPNAETLVSDDSKAPAPEPGAGDEPESTGSEEDAKRKPHSPSFED